MCFLRWNGGEGNSATPDGNEECVCGRFTEDEGGVRVGLNGATEYTCVNLSNPSIQQFPEILMRLNLTMTNENVARDLIDTNDCTYKFIAAVRYLCDAGRRTDVFALREALPIAGGRHWLEDYWISHKCL